MSLVGALTKALKAGETAKKTAPFYSAVDEALANIARPKGTGAEFYTELTKQAGVKKAELADRKLEQAFKAKGKITKEEAQQILKENPPPKVSERVRDYMDDDARELALRDKLETSGYDRLSEVPSRKLSQWNDEIDNEGSIYEKYKTEGGQNYREILLKLPQAFTDREAKRLMELESNLRRGELPTRQMEELVALQAKKQGAQPDYTTTHWTDEPNVLAHMRVQDRTGPNGEKILHVEEIQSDWHQEGRKKGYRNEEAIGKAKQAFTDYSKDARERMRQLMLKEAEGDMAPDRALRFVNQYVDGMDDSAVASFLNEKSTFNNLYRASKDAGATGVPDAPFKKNWHELAMKRLLNYAADKGYDSIAITPGAEQAKRYDLSKQVGQISYTPSTKNLMAFDHEGNAVVNKSNVNPEDLEKYLGAGVTQKLNQAEFEGPSQVLRGTDISVGGEGMMGFYDQILPSYLNTFGKPYGAQVGVFDMPNPRKGLSITDVQKEAGITEQQWLDLPSDEKMRLIDDMDAKAKAATMPLHSFTITPEMRQQIQQKGLPLYQQIGIPTAGAGAASQMPEQMQEPELEPEVKKADGGAINYNTAPDMSDGGRIIQGAPFKRGGKVNISTNRDAMFMELSNKKLKRK